MHLPIKSGIIIRVSEILVCDCYNSVEIKDKYLHVLFTKGWRYHHHLGKRNDCYTFEISVIELLVTLAHSQDDRTATHKANRLTVLFYTCCPCYLPLHTVLILMFCYFTCTSLCQAALPPPATNRHDAINCFSNNNPYCFRKNKNYLITLCYLPIDLLTLFIFYMPFDLRCYMSFAT